MIGFAYNDEAEQRTIVYVILDGKDFITMAAGNPVTVPSQEFGGLMGQVRFPNRLGYLIGYEPDAEKARTAIASGRLHTLLDHVTRNMKLDTPMEEVAAILLPKPGGHA